MKNVLEGKYMGISEEQKRLEGHMRAHFEAPTGLITSQSYQSYQALKSASEKKE